MCERDASRLVNAVSTGRTMLPEVIPAAPPHSKYRSSPYRVHGLRPFTVFDRSLFWVTKPETKRTSPSRPGQFARPTRMMVRSRLNNLPTRRTNGIRPPRTRPSRMGAKARSTGLYALASKDAKRLLATEELRSSGQRTPSVTIGWQPLTRLPNGNSTAEETCNLKFRFADSSVFRRRRRSTPLSRYRYRNQPVEFSRINP